MKEEVYVPEPSSAQEHIGRAQPLTPEDHVLIPDMLVRPFSKNLAWAEDVKRFVNWTADDGVRLDPVWVVLLAASKAARDRMARLSDANASERVTADAELGTGRLGHK